MKSKTWENGSVSANISCSRFFCVLSVHRYEETFTQFYRLFWGDCPINQWLVSLQQEFCSAIDKRRNIESLAWMIKYVVGDGSGRFTKNIIELKI